MATTKYHRKYPHGWDYKAISDSFDNKEVIYYTLKDRGVKSKGVEIFSGRNYNILSYAPSYSRRYTLSNLPEKYKPLLQKLILIHNRTKWSTKPYVHLN